MARKYEIHGGARTRLYNTYNAMRGRCRNPNNEKFPHYGGRGIKVCAEWNSFSAFRDWAHSHGYTDDLTIDRIDNDGNYEPANCQWITIEANSSKSAQGELHPRTHLTDDDIRAIRADRRTQVEIARDYKVSQSSISFIKNHITWSHVC